MEELELLFEAVEKKHSDPISIIREAIKNKQHRFDHIQSERLHDEEWCINRLDKLEKFLRISSIIDKINEANPVSQKVDE